MSNQMIDWNKPLKLKIHDGRQTSFESNVILALRPRGGSDIFVVKNNICSNVFHKDGTYVYSFDEKDTWKHDSCIIENRTESKMLYEWGSEFTLRTVWSEIEPAPYRQRVEDPIHCVKWYERGWEKTGKSKEIEI